MRCSLLANGALKKTHSRIMLNPGSCKKGQGVWLSHASQPSLPHSSLREGCSLQDTLGAPILHAPHWGLLLAVEAQGHPSAFMASARGQLNLELHWCLKSSTTSAAVDETSHPHLPESQEVWEGVASAAEPLLAEGKLINCLQLDVSSCPKAWSCMNCGKSGPPVL